MAEKIDPKNPPPGSTNVLSPGGKPVIVADGKAYDPETGERLPAGAEALVLNATADGTRDAGVALDNPLALFGFNQPQLFELLTRAGIILLGAALAIVGVAFVISGTKTASAVVSAIPVAGKVLK